MTFLSFIDRIIIPATLVILLVGAIAGIALGCALVLRSSATLAFITRMNAWVSTREVITPLEVQMDVEPAAGSRHRPLLGAVVAVGGVIAVYFLLVRLDFARGSYVPGVNATRWILSGVALEATKWILVAGSAFAVVVGLLMALSPARLAAFESRMNRGYASRELLAADEEMHMPLEPHVAAHPRAAGWTIAAASLLVALAMSGLLISRLH